VGPDDVLVWRDGFWCFRVEHRREFQRDDNYSVILQDSDEWSSFLRGLLQPSNANLTGAIAHGI
jgi:hypothetical protein